MRSLLKMSCWPLIMLSEMSWILTDFTHGKVVATLMEILPKVTALIGRYQLLLQFNQIVNQSMTFTNTIKQHIKIILKSYRCARSLSMQLQQYITNIHIL